MATDREILKKLVKIAKNQQRMINKLADYPALEKFVKTMTMAWLANQMGAGKLPGIKKSGQIVEAVTTQDPQSGRFDVQIKMMPSSDWREQDIAALEQLTAPNGEFDKFIYGRLQQIKGLSPQQVRVRTFVMPSPKQEVTVEDEGDFTPATPKDPGADLKPLQDPTNMEKIRMR